MKFTQQHLRSGVQSGMDTFHPQCPCESSYVESPLYNPTIPPYAWKRSGQIRKANLNDWRRCSMSMRILIHTNIISKLVQIAERPPVLGADCSALPLADRRARSCRRPSWHAAAEADCQGRLLLRLLLVFGEQRPQLPLDLQLHAGATTGVSVFGMRWADLLLLYRGTCQPNSRASRRHGGPGAQPDGQLGLLGRLVLLLHQQPLHLALQLELRGASASASHDRCWSRCGPGGRAKVECATAAGHTVLHAAETPHHAGDSPRVTQRNTLRWERC